MGRLRTAAERLRLIGDVRGKGLMIGLDLVTDRTTKAPAAAEAKEIRKRCREAGVLVGLGGTLGNVIRIQPPLCLTADEADRIVDVVEQAIAGVSPGTGP